LNSVVSAAGFLARLGGDEFAILLPNCADPLRLDELTTRIFESLQRPFELREQLVYVSTSIGIAMAPQDASDVEQLLSNADLALYSAKNDGRGVRTFFVRAMQNSSEQRHRLASELRQAVLNEEFQLWYQPQVALANRRYAGAEALLRWQHPDHGLLTPSTFIEVLDSSTIAEEVGDWILEQACAAAAAWECGGLGPLRVAVNLFAAQLRSGHLFGTVSSVLQKYGLAPERLELEITETTVLRHNDEAILALGKLKALGVGIAFDDFGTGFASLSLLQRYPLTCLKIDRSFVARIDRETGDAAIVKAVISMANSLGLTVIAEGVESAEQEAALIGLGCDMVQGYRYGRPTSGPEIGAIFRSRPGEPSEPAAVSRA
jgi:predicted signal transduction protein with EAL and GGDEF domain